MIDPKVLKAGEYPKIISVQKNITSDIIAGTSPWIPRSGFNFRVMALYFNLLILQFYYTIQI